jgi:hypothetical protein
MPNSEDERQAVLAQAEKDRQASQAGAHQAGRQADADTAPDRAADAQAEADMDPNSPEGRQAALRRGDPVQLQGEEGSRGMVQGTATTTNESGSGFPATDEHRFVTGAAGVPIPESAGIAPQRPGDFSPESTGTQEAPEVALPPQEQGGTGTGQAAAEPPSKSAPKAEWVDHAVSQGADPAEAESKTKAQLVEEHGQAPGDGDTGEHGPGVTS